MGRKRRRHLANRNVQQTTSNIRQPAQNLQQNYRGNPARTVQEVQPRQVKPSAGTYAGQLNKQISDRKQISLQNDAAQQPTTSMGIGYTVTHTGDMQKKKAAQQEYATALRSQMAMQEQRKQEGKVTASPKPSAVPAKCTLRSCHGRAKEKEATV